MVMADQLDTADPLVVLLAWGLTQLVARLASADQFVRLRHALPVVALVLAVALRAGFEAVAGEPAMTPEVLIRGLAAGAVAVAGHSQLREFGKAVSGSGAGVLDQVEDKDDGDDADDGDDDGDDEGA